MKKLIMTFLSLIMLISIAGCGASDNDQAAKEKKAAQVSQSQQEVFAPDEVLHTFDGKEIRLKDQYAEKPVYLNFWASWCPPCVKEMPTIQKMYEKYGDKVNFVIVSVDTKPEQAKQFVSSKAFTMPIYTGDLNALSNDYSLSAIPVSIIIDKHGKILKQNVGGMDEAELEKFLTPIVKPASY